MPTTSFPEVPATLTPSATPSEGNGSSLLCPPGSAGIIVFGARDSTIARNDVTRNSGDGIDVVTADPTFGGTAAPPVNDTIRANTLVRNAIDIYYDLTGSHNVFADNKCHAHRRESIPPDN